MQEHIQILTERPFSDERRSIRIERKAGEACVQYDAVLVPRKQYKSEEAHKPKWIETVRRLAGSRPDFPDPDDFPSRCPSCSGAGFHLNSGSKAELESAGAQMMADVPSNEGRSIDLDGLLDAVHDRDTFLGFVKALAADRAAQERKEAANPSSPFGPGGHGWEHNSISSYLDACVRCANGWGDRPCGPLPTLTWKNVAAFLYAGSVYE